MGTTNIELITTSQRRKRMGQPNEQMELNKWTRVNVKERPIWKKNKKKKKKKEKERQ